jgi:hypothetical protein
MPTLRTISLFIEPNPNCPEGCDQRFSACGEPRPVTWVRHSSGDDESILCDVFGWSSAGGGSPCPARAVAVEDSSSGVSTLVYGGDWGLRLTPRGGGEPFGAPYLLLADAGMAGLDG